MPPESCSHSLESRLVHRVCFRADTFDARNGSKAAVQCVPAQGRLMAHQCESANTPRLCTSHFTR
jgi:hypothetical protein